MESLDGKEMLAKNFVISQSLHEQDGSPEAKLTPLISLYTESSSAKLQTSGWMALLYVCSLSF